MAPLLALAPPEVACMAAAARLAHEKVQAHPARRLPGEERGNSIQLRFMPTYPPNKLIPFCEKCICYNIVGQPQVEGITITYQS